MNYSIEGACSSTSEPGCTTSVEQEIGQIPSDFDPTIITVTVGADDIDFGDCIKSMIADSDLALTASTDPCNQSRLTASLTALKANLTTDLNSLSSSYPGAKIYVMDYYNPFPASPPPGRSACAFDQAIAFLYEHAQLKSWWKVARLYVEHHSEFLGDAKSVQSQMFDDSQNIVGQLNNTINSAAAGTATVFGTSDFAGHDICANDGRWVFAPTVAVSFSFNAGPVHAHGTLSSGGEVCPDPVAAADWNKTAGTSFSVTSMGVVISGMINFSMGVNCLPHPNTAGQNAIASDFIQQTGL